MGKGLVSLMGEADAETAAMKSDSVLPISKVKPNKGQPRKTFDETELSELADSIKQNGILQPILVRKHGTSYEIVAGERRYQAAKLAGLDEVPVVIREISDEDVFKLALIENLQREDLNPMEEAEGYQQLMTQYNLTQEETAQRVGKSRSAVANALRLLNLCPPVRAMVEDGRLSNGHARTILPLSPALQEKAADAILKSDLSVRQTELLVKKLTAEEKARPAVTTGGLEVNYAEEAAKSLGAHLGRGCKIVSGRKKGRIELEYYGVDDLNNLLDALNALKLK